MEIENLIEWRPVTLPSGGLFYRDACPGGELEITPWTVAQEEMISRNSEGDQTDITHELLRKNVKWPKGLEYEDLLLTDQFFLLLNLRIISYIDFMTLPRKCPDCGHNHDVEVKLPNIVVKTAEETDPEEPYEITLPRRKIKITIKQQRVGDLISAVRYLKDSLLTAPELRRKFLYARQIESINGQSAQFQEKMEFVSTLSLLDLSVIAEMSERHSTGVQGQYEVECPSCKSLDTRWVPPIHVDFFRPKSVDIERACRLAEED